MNRKSELLAFTVALLSTITLAHPALAGWGTVVDDALRALGQGVRSSGDDVLRGSGQASRKNTVNFVSRQFNPQTGYTTAAFLIGGGAGTVATEYYLRVNCNQRIAQWGNSKQGYQNVDFNYVKKKLC
ncbi:hypothetical protein BZZ01_18605 [Nostocales cyanobacterium HT-58-2]|nr:hypothetical protein BZZ01_18605 [Nostocales cyanobacterium HT-58-2]